MTKTINNSGFKPVDNKILLRKIDTGNTTAGGIIVTKVEGIDKAEVVAVGGRVINVAPGDTIMVDWQSCIPAKLGHDQYYIGLDSTVVGIFDETYSEPVVQLIK